MNRKAVTKPGVWGEGRGRLDLSQGDLISPTNKGWVVGGLGPSVWLTEHHLQRRVWEARCHI